MKYLMCAAVSMIGLLMVGEGSMAKGEDYRGLSLNDVPPAAWKALSQQTIYFGHQSVGNNIIAGINDVLKEHPEIQFRIVKVQEMNGGSGGVFIHEEVGKNDYPFSKSTAFRERLHAGLGEKTDIAFLKYCFWDIRSQTDVQNVFRNYREMIASLRKEFPRLTFVHFTIPLMAHQTGITASAKRFLHLPVEWDVDNIKRSELNELIRNEYAGREVVFDIAEMESTLPSGHRTMFTSDGKAYAYLAADYTGDGGHLNPVGRRRVAEQLLILLAQLATTKTGQ